MTATAAWDAPRLLDALARRGWGDLDGRAHGGLRAVLRALVALLPYESAEGRVTASQVADAAGMSRKWAGRCLVELDRRGLIVYRRGWLDHGTPRPGWVRVCKSEIAAMVRNLRDALDGRRAARRAETRHRLETTLRSATVPPWQRRPLSHRWELSSTLPTPRGRTARGAFGPTDPQAPLIGDETMPTCQVCGRPEASCRAADAKLPLRHQHDYVAGRPDPRQLIVRPTPRHPQKTAAPNGWRSAARVHRPTQPALTEGTDQ